MILCLTSVSEFKVLDDANYLDECIFKIVNKDKEALSDLYHKTSKSVYSFALTLLKNTHDAEDVMHDVYISIFKSASSYKSTGKPMAWIITITKNLCYMKLRERNKRSDIPAEDWEKYLEAKTEVSFEDRTVLAKCMTGLKDDERQIVILHAVSGFKHREIAEILDMRLSTVLSKYNRALKKLNELMRGEWQ